MDNETILLVRCKNPSRHFVMSPSEEAGKEIKEIKDGNIICFIDRSSIYIRCTDYNCKRWTRLTLDMPGIDIDLTKAAIVQDLMPEDFPKKRINREKTRKAMIVSKVQNEHT